MAERSRANKQPDIAERRASVDISHTSPVELTTEEELLEALLVANEELLQALKQWDDLHRLEVGDSLSKKEMRLYPRVRE